MNELDLLEKDMHPLIQKIAVELKLEKTIDQTAIASLNDKLSEYKSRINDQKMISRSFVGILFYLFSTMVWQAQYVNYREDIMLEVFRLRTCLLSVFDENSFK